MSSRTTELSPCGKLIYEKFKGEEVAKVYCYVTGNAKGVIFKQNIIRRLLIRKATKDSKNHQLAHCSHSREEFVVDKKMNKF